MAMNLIIGLLEKYSLKYGTELHTELCLQELEPTLRFVKGKIETRGNTAIYLTGNEITSILELNNILGPEGQVQQMSKSSSKAKDEEIERLIYQTLARYISQMLEAAMGKNYVPELKYLSQHMIYFEFH